MLVSPVLLSTVSGLIRLSPKSHGIQRRCVLGTRFSGDVSNIINGRRVSYNNNNNKYVGGNGNGNSMVMSVCFGRQSWSSRKEVPEEDPLWLSLVRDMVRSTRSLLSFMAEQPSQLKYIEWPSFTSTLKTATLSLCLVGVFVVALSSVDSALCYILALFLRKAP